MSLLRARGLAITALEFAHCLAPFQRHRTTTIASDDAVTSRRARDMAIAVSGGVDSMALATLLARHYSSPGNTTRLHALIVDHKLRNSSTAEAAFVAQQVQLLGITPHVLTLDWSTDTLNDHKGISGVEDNNKNNVSRLIQKPDKAHLETQARLERYKVIAQRCHALQIQDLFVGHHAGDQVETTLFRFTRASGIDGLAGIQGVAPVGVVNVAEALGISVIRPLLTVDKDRLRATCEDAGTSWVEDESNKSLDYQRNVIRHHQQHIDALVGQDPRSELYPLSTPALLAFRDRMDRHRRVAWGQGMSLLCHLRVKDESDLCADVQGIRKQFPNQDDRQKQQGLKELETWLETVPGNAKYTIPVVCLQETFASGQSAEQILSIPSVGLHLYSSTFAVASRFRSNLGHFEKDTEATNAAIE
ncbi:hypothetical protein BGZ70_001911 [Mortierella alpina]|uniref:tRNA(Ile)-lysidine synthetase n=1 Tax=Mortierella alpina TaxID=64518 RepID=A0A9P6LX58_MORAP|nr:hypothetical protein BGZ70_001911 [Mortierella alpina]